MCVLDLNHFVNFNIIGSNDILELWVFEQLCDDINGISGICVDVECEGELGK